MLHSFNHPSLEQLIKEALMAYREYLEVALIDRRLKGRAFKRLDAKRVEGLLAG